MNKGYKVPPINERVITALKGSPALEYCLLIDIPHYALAKLGIEAARQDIISKNPKGKEIRMPCGYAIFIHPSGDLPTWDVPCPCGNPNHYLIKFRVNSNLDTSGKG